ncbi:MULTISPECIES: hypothetical protein [unclassified Chryseobacterium]|uniref:hypothetical protein n=1 Tax=unclassified Chryseobacterium TaxID=2593645 RepID=UPI000D71C40C|nr:MULTISPECIES: hypothetical protein [unclassified Chryseobacterium]PWW19905.1 hypothetical protein DEU40_1165 [Chryseobacterium sp. AG844]
MKKLVLAIAFIGMGSFAMAQQTTIPQDKHARTAEMKQRMEQKQQEHLDQMQKDLNLNASQVAQIKVLQDKRKTEMKAEFDKHKADRQAKMQEMHAKRAQMDADMKKILTPDQYDKWQADRKAKAEKMKMAMKERRMMKKPMNTGTAEVK